MGVTGIERKGVDKRAILKEEGLTVCGDGLDMRDE